MSGPSDAQRRTGGELRGRLRRPRFLGGKVRTGASASESLARLHNDIVHGAAGWGNQIRGREDVVRMMGAYRAASDAERLALLESLVSDFGVDRAEVVAAAERIVRAGSDDELAWAVREGRSVLEAPWVQLLGHFNRVPGGTKFLVDLRADLRRFSSSAPELVPLELDLKDLLTALFDVGLLELRRITWDAPASMLEKLARSEAVHAVAGWDDLKNRLKPDRRFFAFFHPQMPDEPVIFVQVGLTTGLVDSIAPLLDVAVPPIDVARADTATFYSISSAQPGLAGINIGGFLIKQVVEEMRTEVPRLKTFATLSPIPGFARWLEKLRSERLSGECETLDRLTGDAPLAELLANDNAVDGQASPHEQLEIPLLRLCAQYLVGAKRADGRALDPVANFHLANGARIERLNWLADRSPRGLETSFGLMVNYLYDLDRIDANHDAYLGMQRVMTSSSVARLVPAAADRQTG